MKIFVISLLTADKRRMRVEQQFGERSIPFEFFDACTGGQAICARLFDVLDVDNFVLNTGRHMTSAEVGCFASHRELWKHCIEIGESITILEDDFDLLPAFDGALRAAERVIGKAGYLRLQTDGGDSKTPVTRLGHFTVSRYTKAPQCMMAYCISPGVARRFVDATRVCDAPVDVFMKKYWEHGNAIHALTPFAVAPSVLSTETMIPDRVKAKKRFAVRVRRFLLKVGWYWNRWAFNFRYISVPLI